MPSHNLASPHGLLSDQPFPAFPFRDSRWIGFVLNRDLYGAAGVPRDVFEAVTASLSNASGSTRLIFESGVVPLGDHGGFLSRELSGWDEYVSLVKSMDFCPDYYLTSLDRSVIFWFDPETVVVGGRPEVMHEVIDSLGGKNEIRERSAHDFGVTLRDPDSKIATYIQNLCGT